MKKLLLMAMLAVGTTAFADDYKYMVFACNGTEEPISLETIKKITFEGGQVIVATTDGQKSFVQNQMEKMYFSVTATAIDNITSDSSKSKGDVYDLAGRKMVSGKLPKGIYIVEGKKVIVK